MTRDVLIVHGIFDGRGGVQIRWRHFARDLARSRNVTVLTWAPGWRPRSRMVQGYRVVTLPSLASWDRDRSTLLEMANTAVSIVTGLVAAMLLRRRWQFAIGVGLHPDATVAGVAAQLRRLPFIAETWLVGPLGNVERLRRSLLRRPVVMLLGRSRAVLSATEVGASELESIGVPSGVVRVSPLTVDTDRFCPPSADQRQAGRAAIGAQRAHTIVYAGRFDLRQKRLDVLLEAWGEVDAPGWELALVGSGEDHDAVVDLATTSTRPVRIVGWVDDVATVLHGADAFVLPTEFESPGYALLEGMASALPGVASAIDVYEELAPDGVELAPNNPAAWASALRRLTSTTAQERLDRGARCLDWIRCHTSAPAVHQLIEELDR